MPGAPVGVFRVVGSVAYVVNATERILLSIMAHASFNGMFLRLDSTELRLKGPLNLSWFSGLTVLMIGFFTRVMYTLSNVRLTFDEGEDALEPTTSAAPVG